MNVSLSVCRQCNRIIYPGWEATRRTALGVQKYPHYHQPCWDELQKILRGAK